VVLGAEVAGVDTGVTSRGMGPEGPGRASGMSDKTDQAKGRIKEAAGDLTGDKDLKKEGRVERTAGEAKEKVGDAVDAVKDKVKDVLDR
jgi:uncharacterized protein YjbJ (UPF0337 family)